MLQALSQLADHAASSLLDALIKWQFEAGSERELRSSLGLTRGAEGRQLRKTVGLQPALKTGTRPSRLLSMAGMPG